MRTIKPPPTADRYDLQMFDSKHRFLYVCLSQDLPGTVLSVQKHTQLLLRVLPDLLCKYPTEDCGMVSVPVSEILTEMLV